MLFLLYLFSSRCVQNPVLAKRHTASMKLAKLAAERTRERRQTTRDRKLKRRQNLVKPDALQQPQEKMLRKVATRGGENKDGETQIQRERYRERHFLPSQRCASSHARQRRTNAKTLFERTKRSLLRFLAVVALFNAISQHQKASSLEEEEEDLDRTYLLGVAW